MKTGQKTTELNEEQKVNNVKHKIKYQQFNSC